MLSNGKDLLKFEVCVSLPFEMLIEQVQLQLKNTALFNKYLKVLRIDKSEEEDALQLALKSGLHDKE